MAASAAAVILAACGSSGRSDTSGSGDAGAASDAGDAGADVACAPFHPLADEPHWPVGPDTFDASGFVKDEGQGIVAETATGLVFELRPGTDLTFDEAACRCAQLRTAGASDWRLASRFELDRLVDYVKKIPALLGPAFDPTMFPDAPVGGYWTSTLYASPNPAQVDVPYFVALGDGTARGTSQTGAIRAAAWCVRGGNAPATPVRFALGTTTVTDTWTKLVWQRTVPPEAQALDHDGAAAYCAALELDGAGGFRIPGAKELQTIVAAGRREPAIDQGLFPSTPSLLFHTNTRYSAQPDDTWWFVEFTDGSALPTTVYPSSGRKAEPVRCVRSLP